MLQPLKSQSPDLAQPSLLFTVTRIEKRMPLIMPVILILKKFYML